MRLVRQYLFAECLSEHKRSKRIILERALKTVQSFAFRIFVTHVACRTCEWSKFSNVSQPWRSWPSYLDFIQRFKLLVISKNLYNLAIGNLTIMNKNCIDDSLIFLLHLDKIFSPETIVNDNKIKIVDTIAFLCNAFSLIMIIFA